MKALFSGSSDFDEEGDAALLESLYISIYSWIHSKIPAYLPVILDLDKTALSSFADSEVQVSIHP